MLYNITKEKIMAEFDFTEFTASKDGSSTKVGYFNSLKDDGDETLVRFDYDTSADFKVVVVHRVEKDGKHSQVSCLRDMYEKKDEHCKCPFCRQGDKYPTKVKAYVRMIEYSRDADGNVIVTPVVWERGSGFYNDISGAIKDGVDNGLIPAGTSIRDIVFKVRRSGKAKSSDTRFFLTAGNPKMYPEEVYTKDFSGFEKYDASKHAYWVKTAEEMERYIETGSWKKPEAGDEEAQINNPSGIEEAPVEEPAPVTPATPKTPADGAITPSPRRVQL